MLKDFHAVKRENFKPCFLCYIVLTLTKYFSLFTWNSWFEHKHDFLFALTLITNEVLKLFVKICTFTFLEFSYKSAFCEL